MLPYATRAPIANPPNSAQVGGSLYSTMPPIKLHPRPCSSVGVPRTAEDRHTDAWPQYILGRLRLTQNVTIKSAWGHLVLTSQFPKLLRELWCKYEVPQVSKNISSEICT